MSAFVVDREHIDLLTRYALRGTSKFQWWQVDEDGNFAGWRYLDELASGDDPERVSPSQFGQILLSENVKSVSYRYNDEGRTHYYGAEHAAEMEPTPDEELPGPCDRYYLAPHVYGDPGYTLSPGELFAAIDTLDYQSCEHPTWMQSEAFALLRSLREDACRRVAGYAEAPHTWDRDEIAKRGPLEFSRRIL